MPERNFSYWEEAAGIPQKSLSQDAPPSRTDVAIVGAGFCGSWLAYFLLKKNPSLKVTRIERDFFNLGASVRNAGFLSCGNISEWLEDSKAFSWEEIVLTLEGRMEGINIIRSEFRDTHPRSGSGDFDPLTDEKKELISRLNKALSSPIYSLKEVDLGGRKVNVPFNSFDSDTDPCQLLLKLHERIRSLGAQFLWQTNVTKIGNGECGGLKYDYAFVCTNAFSRNLNPKTSIAPARGQIIVTSPCSTSTTRLMGYLRSGYDYFRFIGDRVLVGGGRLEFKNREDTDSFEVTEEIRTYLLKLAEKVIGHNQFTVDYHWSGIMGLRRGGHASVSDLKKTVMLDSKTEELAGFGGWGVTLTPLVAKNRVESFTL